MDEITEKYGRNRNNVVMLSKNECSRVFEDWCTRSRQTLDAKLWKYSMKMIENILSSSLDKESIKIMLRGMLAEERMQNYEERGFIRRLYL